jgi:hypothetical protein
MAKRESICWNCANACGKCSWSNGTFIPVKGWQAEFTVCNGTPSYLVSSCPKFKICPVLKKDKEMADALHIQLKDFYVDKLFYVELYLKNCEKIEHN